MANAGMRLLGKAAVMSEIDDMRSYWGSSATTWVVGTPVNYADDQEFGPHGTPHFRPAIDSTQAQLARIAVQASGLDDYLQTVALTLERDVKLRAPVLTGNLRSSYAAQPKD